LTIPTETTVYTEVTTETTTYCPETEGTSGSVLTGVTSSASDFSKITITESTIKTVALTTTLFTENTIVLPTTSTMVIHGITSVHGFETTIVKTIPTATTVYTKVITEYTTYCPATVGLEENTSITGVTLSTMATTTASSPIAMTPSSSASTVVTGSYTPIEETPAESSPVLEFTNGSAKVGSNGHWLAAVALSALFLL
jgi:hypothetical protein